MAKRKYSVEEIDQMRSSCQAMVSNAGAAEDQLRTYMLNGTTPEELREAAQMAIERRRANYAHSMRMSDFTALG